MLNKMLIDASHPEETRVVVVRGNRIEDYDFESVQKKQIKGNIYLARVTRVEPSLQAAFVEYGGNRHGFLAFSEIHPDYYQIPVADRLALLAAEEEAASDDTEDEAAESEVEQKKQRRNKRSKGADIASPSTKSDETASEQLDEFPIDEEDDIVESVGAEDALEEVPTHQRDQRRQYKIQEVIKRRQILLVQVVKEERGNKGAALTTYLSLAGRYSVLMPNTARGGGISRKITNIQDRKRLKDIVKGLEVPKGIGVILRTAGANRTKSEIKRDYEYLMRLWENVRTLTLNSTAPCMVYEEGSLIKRSIRDLYNKDIEEILVAGDKGYREAKEFMRMLMPRHAKVVQPYRDPYPIFARNGIESQLDNMIQPQVPLKSGGYLVINQTEALVAIDVNSGRSTKENSIEETAHQTNLEAAEEVARQLRLRDLAGLVVIDFIDMEDRRNIQAVEKKLKDCLKDDRARIQVGRISHFGLLEMSRQRIRASVLDSTMIPCPHCNSTGYIRSDSSIALHVIRSIEEYLLRNGHFNITVRTPVAIALYVLNHKRQILADLESRFGLLINIEADDTVGAPHLAIYKGAPAEGVPAAPIVALPEPELDDEDIIAEQTDEDEEQVDEARTQRNRKRRRRGQRDNEPRNTTDELSSGQEKNSEEEHRRRRRRGRRGGRRNRDNDFDRIRIPYAEPVGEFAKTALAEIKLARRNRKVPMAEPVGDFYSHETVRIPIKTTHKPTQKRARSYSTAEPVDRNVSTGTDLPEPIVNSEAVNVVDMQQPQQEATKDAEQTKPKQRGRRPKNPQATEQSPVSETVVNTVVAVNPISEPTKLKRKPTTRRRKLSDPLDNGSDNSATFQRESDALSSPSNINVSNEAVVSQPTDSAPMVNSLSEEQPEAPKKTGWWQRKGFF